ncbi:hypothetical protein KO481_29415 [Nocardia sp. NEAU-G5]|uniref:DUF8020 domain-containing protein n=1 Tax=Nocardia albiluteola TaxID=2842303 RepID=A0ABS6AZU1_9NOCA|nr:hypothetical protein [Nocardia albiluteola]MBU3062533.1 hypothetical protein [Nocardia albiluteola]MBU3065633.1 hypothetical protein [Nocardia albiluteola]
MRKSITLTVAAVATATATIATAHAEPGAGEVGYHATVSETATTITTDAGSLASDGGRFTIKAPDGTVLAGTDLTFRVDDFVFPITADITGRTARLTPLFDRQHAQYQPVALPFENQAPWKSEYEREQTAWNRLATTLQMGASIGTAAGTVGGAAVGCVLGGIAGATVAAAAIIGLFGAFLPAAAIGCLGGMMALSALGAIAGTLFVATPIALMAAAQYFTTINQPAPTPAR